MAKIVIAGDAVVITSSKTLEQIATLEEYNPKALSLFEKDDNGMSQEIFRVGTTNGAGNINKFGASFGSATHDEQGFATITLSIPRDIEDVMSYVANAIGYAVVKLNKVEAQFDTALQQIEADRQQVMSNITMA